MEETSHPRVGGWLPKADGGLRNIIQMKNNQQSI